MDGSFLRAAHLLNTVTAVKVCLAQLSFCKFICNRNLQTYKAPMKSLVQGTSLLTSAASNQKGCPEIVSFTISDYFVVDDGDDNCYDGGVEFDVDSK